MTTSDLIRLLEKHEYGASGRPREITIYIKDKDGKTLKALSEKETMKFYSSGDGVAGAELSLEVIRE